MLHMHKPKLFMADFSVGLLAQAIGASACWRDAYFGKQQASKNQKQKYCDCGDSLTVAQSYLYS